MSIVDVSVIIIAVAIVICSLFFIAFVTLGILFFKKLNDIAKKANETADIVKDATDRYTKEIDSGIKEFKSFKWAAPLLPFAKDIIYMILRKK